MRAVEPDPIELRALVLPAFVGEPGGPCERRQWLEGVEFEGAQSVRGLRYPLHYTADGIGLAPTGMGKAAAAASTAALCSDPAIDLSEAVILSVGIAGIAPDRGTLGSVMLADTVVDWDQKFRLDPTEPDSIGLLPYRRGDPVYRLDEVLVSGAMEAAGDAELVDDDRLEAKRERYEEPAAQAGPDIGVGPTVSSDEYWHGTMLAEQVQWVLDQYGVGRLTTTQMEDFGTAYALSRFGHLERYLSVRAAVNFDRQPPGQTASESFEAGEQRPELAVGLENAYRVGVAIVDSLGGRRVASDGGE